MLRAARRLHVAQPSVSRQIQDLEREIGCQLLERLARGVRLTPAGVAFLQEARSTVENATRAIAIARDAEGRARPSLILAAGRSSYYPPDVVSLLTRFRTQHPNCDLEMRLSGDRDQQAGLREHRISAALAWTTGEAPAEFAHVTIRDCALQGVLLSASHPLEHQSYVSLPQLQSLTRLHSPRGAASGQYRALRNALLMRGLEPVRHRAVGADITTVCMYVVAGDAFMLANERMARAYVAASDGVVYRRFAEPPIPLSLTLLWRNDETSPFVQGLVRIAMDMTLRDHAVA